MADSKQVMFGLKNVHYAVIGDGGSYGTPVHIPGAVSMSVSRAGEESTFHADNSPYFVFQKNSGYTGTLTMAKIPEDFLIAALGYVKDANGMLLEDSEVVAKQFALMFEIASNTDDERFILFDCTASRPEQDHNTTTDTTEVDTQELNFTAIPHEFAWGNEKKMFVQGVVKSGDTGYADFFKTVATPSKGA